MFNPDFISGEKELLEIYEKLLPVNRKLILAHIEYLFESQNNENIPPAIEPELSGEKAAHPIHERKCA
jgi:hypothetical protein